MRGHDLDRRRAQFAAPWRLVDDSVSPQFRLTQSAREALTCGDACAPHPQLSEDIMIGSPTTHPRKGREGKGREEEGWLRIASTLTVRASRPVDNSPAEPFPAMRCEGIR